MQLRRFGNEACNNFSTTNTCESLSPKIILPFLHCEFFESPQGRRKKRETERLLKTPSFLIGQIPDPENIGAITLAGHKKSS